MSSMRSGGATPEISQNYIGGCIVFNAIHAWLQCTNEDLNAAAIPLPATIRTLCVRTFDVDELQRKDTKDLVTNCC